MFVSREHGVAGGGASGMAYLDNSWDVLVRMKDRTSEAHVGEE